MTELTDKIEPPKYVCAKCGWTSYSTRYDLVYHKKNHTCEAPKAEPKKV